MLQLPLAAMIPPLRLTLLLPATAVTTPPHVLVTPGVDATITPAGRGSVNATVLSPVTLFGFVIVMVMTDVPLTVTEAGAKALVTVGGSIGVIRTEACAIGFAALETARTPGA